MTLSQPTDYREATARIFKQLWIGALVLGVAFGGAASIWPEYSVPLLAVPAVVAALWGMVLGWTWEPEHPWGNQTFTSDLWLRLQQKYDSTNQLDLFEAMVPDAAQRRKVHRIITTQGEIRVVHIERFLELLVSRTLVDTDKATEHAMALAWHRCCDDLQPHLRPVLNKIFREAFKADMSGNIIRLLSRQGESIIAELRPLAEPTEQSEPFELSAVEPLKPRKKRGK